MKVIRYVFILGAIMVMFNSAYTQDKEEDDKKESADANEADMMMK